MLGVLGERRGVRYSYSAMMVDGVFKIGSPDILPVQRRGPLGSLVVDPDVAEPPLCRTIEELAVD